MYVPVGTKHYMKKKKEKTRILYLACQEAKVVSPVFPVTLPKGCVKLYPVFETEQDAINWGGEIVLIKETLYENK